MAYGGRRSESARESPLRWEGRLDLDRVLAGHAIATARELIDLIHDVNPTGREVDRAQAARRYAIKTRLQSLLVDRFSDEMEVVPDDREGVVLLRHKYLGLAASHAVVADLEADARAWVQLQLDLGVVSEAWASTPAELERQLERRRHERGRIHRRKGQRARPSETTDARAGAIEMVAALDEGRIAQANYDYEVARAAFERAHDLAPDASAPLAALLDLLVNQLGLDQEALDVAEAARSTALHSATALAATALAAARLGDRERALVWGRALEGAQAAEVFRTLAAGAIAAGDLVYATEALERARRSLPNDAQRILVEVQLERAQAAAVVEDEASLAQLVAKGGVTAAAELAHQIVERHPGSAPARAVLKQAATQERRARQQALLDEARAATLDSSFRQARQALSAARAWGATALEIADLERTMVAAEARAAQLAHANLLDTVAAHLAGAPADRKAALVAYLGFDRQDREELRRRWCAEELVWLDEIAPETPAARGEPIAAAVLAARAATDLLAADNVDGAERLLACHRSVLGEHGFGRSLLARLESALQASQQARALVALAKASAALQAKDFDGAKDLLDSVVRDRLPAPAQGEWDRLAQALTWARQHKACLEMVDARLAKQKPIGARQLLLERLAESHNEDERASLMERLVQVDDAVRKVHAGMDYAPPPGYLASAAPEMVTNYSFDRGVETLLLPGGKIAVLLSAGQTQCAARLVDVDSGEIRRLLTWALMEALVVKSVGLADDRLWIQDFFFHYAEISCDSWLPCRQCNLRPNSSPGNTLERCVSVPGHDVAWIKTMATAGRDRPHLLPFDIAHGAVVAWPDDEAEVYSDVYAVPGTTPPLLALFGLMPALVLVSARGKDEVFIPLPQDSFALAVALAPGQNGYVVLVEPKDGGNTCLDLLLTDIDGFERSCLRLAVAYRGAPYVATILSTRLVCVSYRARDSGQTRIAYLREQQEGGLVLVADVALPGLYGIAQDPAASSAVAVCRSAYGASLSRLDDMPTAFPSAYELFAVPRMFKLVDCSPPPEPERESRLHSNDYAGLRESDAAYADSKLEALAEGVDRSLEAVTTYRMLRLRGIDGRADRLLEYMERQSKNNFFVRLAIVEREALAGRWVGDDLEQEAAAAGASQHLLHIRVVADLRAGRLDQAIATLTGRAVPGACRLDVSLVLAQALSAERAGEPMRSEELASPGLANLIRAIFAADRALARGDRAEVLRLLDHAWVREICETQSIARLVEVYLATGKADSPIQRLRASTVMISFIDNYFIDGSGHQLWLGENTWPAERLVSLSEKAHAWMFSFAWKSEAP